MKSRASIAVLVCVLVAIGHSSPTGKKNSASKKAELDKGINPSPKNLAEDGDDDLLARTKKSSTTTFCVEIKPGNDQPTVVVCDPNNNNQQPLPSPPPPPTPPPAPTPTPPHPAPQPQPHPQPEPQPDSGYYPYPQPPQFIPDFPQLIPQMPFSFEPLQVLVPQMPQMPQMPQILSPYPQQPQVIFVRDPGCAANNPAMMPSPWQQSPYPGLVPSTRYYGKSAGGFPMNPAESWKNGFAPEEGKIRSFTGSNGLQSPTGYLSSLDTIYSNRGLLQPSSSSQSAQLPNSQNPYERPLLIQCNPSVVPLPQNYNSASGSGAASAAGSGSYDQLKLRSAATEDKGKSSMDQSQFMYSPIQASNGMYMNHGAMPYMRQSAASDSAFTAQSHNQNKQAAEMGPITSEANPLDQATQHVQGILKSRQESRSSSDGQDHQGHQNVASDAAGGKSMQNDQPQKTMSSQFMTGDQSMGGSGFAQGKNDFSQKVGDQLQEANGNGQGYQRQMTLSVGQGQGQQQPQQQQQQQKMVPNGDPRNVGAAMNHYQQPLTPNEQRLQMMKAAASNNNLQPFMIRQSQSVGDKQTQMKV